MDGQKRGEGTGQADWQALHRRFVSGEALSAPEQADYEAGCAARDAEEMAQFHERRDGDLDGLRALRAQIAQAQADQAPLRRREDALDDRIARLEARLDDRTRRLLGVGG